MTHRSCRSDGSNEQRTNRTMRDDSGRCSGLGLESLRDILITYQRTANRLWAVFYSHVSVLLNFPVLKKVRSIYLNPGVDNFFDRDIIITAIVVNIFDVQ